MNRNLWHRLAVFFEHGDLTPFAVIISIAHYGPVLAAHGENVIVAWLVGTIVDLIHFRTVRRLFQVQGRRRIIGHGIVALMTTAIATMYHFRFYSGDWLLALPIPIGIGILAQHAATRAGQNFVTKWRNRVRFVIAIGKRERKRANEFEVKNGVLSAQVTRLTAEIEKMRSVNPTRNTTNLPRNTRKHKPTASGKIPMSWRKLSDTQRKQLAGMTPGEMAEIYPKLSDRTRRLWAQRAREFSANGHEK